MDPQRHEKNPAPGEPILANAPRTIDRPVGKTMPCHLADVMLNQPGDITAWHHEYSTLPEPLDCDPGDDKPSEVDVSCENGHKDPELAPALLIAAPGPEL